MLSSLEGISIAIYGSVILKMNQHDKLIGFTNNFYKLVAISRGELGQRNNPNIKNNENFADVEVDGAMNFSLLGSHIIGNRNNAPMDRTVGGHGSATRSNERIVRCE